MFRLPIDWSLRVFYLRGIELYIYQRGKRWHVCEQVDGKAVRRSLGAHIKTEAEAMAVVFAGYTVDQARAYTLDEFFEDFIRHCRIRLSRASIARYNRSFKTLMVDLGYKYPLADLTCLELNRWAGRRLDNGRSPEGVNIDLRHIRAALRRAEEMEIIDKAPKVDMVRVSRRLPRHLNQSQVDQILSAEPSPGFRRLWIFLLWTGLRRSEAQGLDWRDVTLGDCPSITVIGKGSRERVVPLLRPALEAMGEVKGLGPVFSLGGLDNLTSHFKSTARLAGVPFARLHDLRHTCLTFLVGQAVPLKLVQDIAGHSTITTTMNYAKIFTGNAHDILNKAFGF